MTEEELKAKKFVWAYMLEAGNETNGEWSYYGSRWGYPLKKSAHEGWPDTEIDWSELEPRKKAMLERVKKVGVNWEKTTLPESGEESNFNGTFSPASRTDTLLGIIQLKDGTVFQIGVSGAEIRFKEYLEHLQKLLDDKKRVSNIFGEEE